MPNKINTNENEMNIPTPPKVGVFFWYQNCGQQFHPSSFSYVIN